MSCGSLTRGGSALLPLAAFLTDSDRAIGSSTRNLKLETRRDRTASRSLLGALSLQSPIGVDGWQADTSARAQERQPGLATLTQTRASRRVRTRSPGSLLRDA
jgi:hypothetical protein